jgi:hypothetical protein
VYRSTLPSSNTHSYSLVSNKGLLVCALPIRLPALVLAHSLTLACTGSPSLLTMNSALRLILCYGVNIRTWLNDHIAILVISSRNVAHRCIVDIFVLDIEDALVDIDMILFSKPLVDCIVKILNCFSSCRITQVRSRNVLHHRSRDYPS